MRIRHFLPICVVAIGLLTGCSKASEEPSGATDRSSAPAVHQSDPAGDGSRTWEPDDAMRRAERALKAA